MPQVEPPNLAFDDVVIDFAGRRLHRGGVEQALEPKAFAVLELLAGSPGRAFTRDEILDVVWGHRHVTQSVLNRVMSLLRQALGEDARHPRLLHTVHGTGYRFDLPAPATVASQRTASPPSTTPAPKRRPWLVVLAACAMLLAVAGWWLSHMQADPPKPSAADARARPALAVLPFADLSPTGDQGYLADGLAEDILDQLAQAQGLRVVGRTSSFSFRGSSEDPHSIGRQLGVAYLLEGSVRRDGERLRIVVRLVGSDDGSRVWSRTYDRELRDALAVQEEIARDVARALSVKLDVATFNREQGGTTNVEAYERYLRYRSTMMLELFDYEHDRERLQLAREMVALDPGCVLCRDALASALKRMAGNIGGEQAARLNAESVQVREQIARMAPDSWVAKRDRSNAMWREGKRAEALALARKIADTGPPSKERVWDYAYMLYAMGHLNETIALVEQVRAVEPLALFLSRDLQYDYTAARRYEDAEAEYQRGLGLEGSQVEPTYVAFMRQLAGKRAGGPEELHQLHRQLQQQGTPFDTPFFRDLGNALDQRAAMLALVRRALADDAYGGVDAAYVPSNVADALGDTELAVAGLRKELHAQAGFADHTMPQYLFVAFWNLPYSNARSHPSFRQLLIEGGVVDYWRQTGKWGDGCEPVGADDFRCQ